MLKMATLITIITRQVSQFFELCRSANQVRYMVRLGRNGFIYNIIIVIVTINIIIFIIVIDIVIIIANIISSLLLSL